jgi:hypothetical protein
VNNLGTGDLEFEVRVQGSPPPLGAPRGTSHEGIFNQVPNRKAEDLFKSAAFSSGTGTGTLTTFTPRDASKVNIPSGPILAPGSKQGIIWDNVMDYSYGLGATQWDETISFDALIADDFMLDANLQVTRVDWLGGYWGGPPDDGDFNWEVVFYYDFGDGTKPGATIATYSFANADVNETFIEGSPGGSNFYSYSVDLPTPVGCDAGTKYWISVQGIGVYPPQSGWGIHTSLLLHEAVFKSVYFGFPNWTNTSSVFGIAVDAAFQLTGESPCPMSVSPDAGTVLAESFFDVFLTFDGTVFENCVDETLTCYLVFTSNDCDEPEVTVPVSMWSARGDVDEDCKGDCKINVLDVVFLINYLFLDPPGPAPDPLCMGDIKVPHNGVVDSDDVLYLISYLFLYGPPPEIPLAPTK